MGIFISYALSNSVTQKEWKKVYEESLYLAQKLALADFTDFSYKGINLHCYRKISEHQENCDGKNDPHWCAMADYKYMNDAEEFWVRKKLENKEYNPDAGAAILHFLPNYTNHKIDGPMCNQVKLYWGSKTQGHTYHAYLLGIACMLETRLKEKVYIYGDIEKEHCEIAVDIINQYAKEPVELPARCDFGRLYNLVKSQKISEEDKLLLMEGTYLGKLDLVCGDFIRKNFDEETLNTFWKNKFKKEDTSVFEITKALTTYLSLGFDLKEINKYLSFDDTIICENFICALIDIGNKQNPLIAMTKEELLAEAEKQIGDKIDIKAVIAKKEKEDESYNNDSFIMKLKKIENEMKEEHKKLLESEDKYDINLPPEFIYYKKGQTISPELLECLSKTKEYVIEKVKEPYYIELLQDKPKEQIEALIIMNSWFPVRDIDWTHAIDYFETHEDALKRYYPLFRMDIGYATPFKAIAQALFINDDFYEFFKDFKSEEEKIK